ncbi:hypothetical protein K2173_021627 [Erythroxylum novogranatense]|uniref:Uncharacterized protein n=1 Tax=Erythroxylum novogranatense TaxID=1862640 RepID=A0AAV8TQS0_9ROSI|nr:hypothetical protein K2173_021627 [Erythroxylum novogranatense]
MRRCTSDQPYGILLMSESDFSGPKVRLCGGVFIADVVLFQVAGGWVVGSEARCFHYVVFGGLMAFCCKLWFNADDAFFLFLRCNGDFWASGQLKHAPPLWVFSGGVLWEVLAFEGGRLYGEGEFDPAPLMKVPVQGVRSMTADSVIIFDGSYCLRPPLRLETLGTN